jgi:hypothetical protein
MGMKVAYGLIVGEGATTYAVLAAAVPDPGVLGGRLEHLGLVGVGHL